MFINKNKKGFGWHSVVSTEEIGLQDPLYLNFSFKKGCNPDQSEYGEKGSIKGDLYFHSEKGIRKVFPVAREYQGRVWIEFKLLELDPSIEPVKHYKRNEVETDINVTDDPIDEYKVTVDTDELPFY